MITPLPLGYRVNARALLVDPEDRLFLLRCELEHLDFWLAPGGGVGL